MEVVSILSVNSISIERIKFFILSPKKLTGPYHAVSKRVIIFLGKIDRHSPTN